MTNLERVQVAKASIVEAALLLDNLQAKDSEVWIHSRVTQALTLIRNANAALEALSQHLIGCGNNSN